MEDVLTGLAHLLAPLNDSILEQQARFGPAITDAVSASPGVML